MKKYLGIFILFILTANVKSQNLVPNPSFEIITTSVPTFGQIPLAHPWFQPNNSYLNTTWSSSSDLFNSWSDTSDVSVPTNIMGFQHAHSGNGYAGIYCYNDTFNFREYIEVPLINSLVANRRYCVELYISLVDISQFSISNIGAYFSTDSLLDNSTYEAIDYIVPQIENPDSIMLNDTSNWMKVSGSFIASGGEKFMTIGNFHNPTNTLWQATGFGTPSTAYYYIDDVSVVDCTGDGVREETDANGINIYPNPTTDAITVELKTKTKQGGMVEIKDVLGQVVYSSKINTAKTVIDIGGFAKGVYFVEVGNERKKIVKE